MFANTPTLAEVLKNSYAKNKAHQMGGFEYDSQLSNHNHQVYYDPKDKKLLFSVTGTHNAHDWLDNIKLGLGYGFKESNRYKESHKALRDAKSKYHVNNATVVGHSQGGYTAQNISSTGDKVLTFDSATTIGHKLRTGENYRYAGDLVSLLDSNKKHSKTINNNKVSQETALKAGLAYKYKNPNLAYTVGSDIIKSINPILGTAAKVGLALATKNPIIAFDAAADVLNSHGVDKIGNNKIFV